MNKEKSTLAGVTGSARRAMGCIALLSLLLIALFLASFILGRYDVPITQVIRILLSQFLPLDETWEPNMRAAVINIRLPRIALACLVGCCLSLAGTAYQSVFQNPMAAPDILGASSGACFGAALAILLGMSRNGITGMAFFFSLLTVALVYLIGMRTRGSRVVSILLAGVMVSSLFSAGTSYIKLVADPSNQLPEITYWLMGSLSGTRLADVGFALVPMAIGIVPLLSTSMIMGAGFLLLVDNVSLNLLATEIPIRIPTAFVGTPFFIYLMTRKENNL